MRESQRSIGGMCEGLYIFQRGIWVFCIFGVWGALTGMAAS